MMLNGMDDMNSLTLLDAYRIYRYSCFAYAGTSLSFSPASQTALESGRKRLPLPNIAKSPSRRAMLAASVQDGEMAIFVLMLNSSCCFLTTLT